MSKRGNKKSNITLIAKHRGYNETFGLYAIIDPTVIGIIPNIDERCDETQYSEFESIEVHIDEDR